MYTQTFYGVMAPAGTPKDIVDRLNKEINAILQSPDMQERLGKLAAQTTAMSPAEFAKFVKDEITRYGEIVKLSGAQKVD